MRLIIPFSIIFLILNVANCYAEIEFKFFGVKKGRLAFTYIENGESDIYTIDFDKLAITPLIVNKGVIDESPDWSPDGTKIAYHSELRRKKEIYIADYNGANSKLLVASPSTDENPDWSPDGKQIAFQRKNSDGSSAVLSFDLESGKIYPVTSSQKKNSVPKWSPRGTEIIYTTDEYWPGLDLILFDIRAKTKTVLTTGQKSFYRPAWTTDGGGFAFSYGTGNVVDIWYQKKGESLPVALIEREGRDFDAVWIDEGNSLFFVSESTAGKGDFQLFYLDVTTSKIDQVVSSTGVIRNLSWNPYPTVSTLKEKIANPLNFK